jgi:DNA repair exonuclease SbcCD ATPase subunit
MEEAIAKLQGDLAEADSRKAFEKRRLEVNAEGVHERLQRLLIEEDQVSARIKRHDAGQSVFVNANYISDVREQIATAMSRVVELTEAEHVLLEEEQLLRQDLSDAQRTCLQLEEAKQFGVFLSGINVERCPHCEHAITLVPADVEIRNGHCHVCKNELHVSNPTYQLETLLKTEREREAKLKADMRRLKQDIRNAGKDRSAAEAQLETLRAELKDLPRQERAGYDAEIRELLNRQGFLKGQIENLREHTTERAREKLQSLEVEEAILSATLDQLRGSVAARNRQVLNRLDALTTALTLSFGLSGVDQVGVNAQFNLYIKQDERNMRFEKMELSEKLRLKIAFHLAMLVLRVSDGIGRHPGLLIVDAPGGAEIDPLRFGDILLGFKEIKEQLGDQVQILIASTREELEQVCPTESLERKGNNEFMF